MRLGKIDARRILRLVLVKADVALVVVGFTKVPSKYPIWSGRIGDSAFRCLAVPGGDVVLT